MEKRTSKPEYAPFIIDVLRHLRVTNRDEILDEVYKAMQHRLYPADHVVLTNVAEKSPYDAAVSAFLKLHPDALVLRFEGRDPKGVRQDLLSMEPRYVTVVLPPEHRPSRPSTTRWQLALDIEHTLEPGLDSEPITNPSDMERRSRVLSPRRGVLGCFASRGG